jgi:hypothetical protein
MLMGDPQTWRTAFRRGAHARTPLADFYSSPEGPEEPNRTAVRGWNDTSRGSSCDTSSVRRLAEKMLAVDQEEFFSIASDLRLGCGGRVPRSGGNEGVVVMLSDGAGAGR